LEGKHLSTWKLVLWPKVGLLKSGGNLYPEREAFTVNNKIKN
jgi:hypothetical protein